LKGKKGRNCCWWPHLWGMFHPSKGGSIFSCHEGEKRGRREKGSRPVGARDQFRCGRGKGPFLWGEKKKKGVACCAKELAKGSFCVDEGGRGSCRGTLWGGEEEGKRSALLRIHGQGKKNPTAQKEKKKTRIFPGKKKKKTRGTGGPPTRELSQRQKEKDEIPT